MNELEITARELILAIMEKTLKSLKNKGLLKEPSKLQMLCSSPEMEALIKKLAPPKYDPNRLFRKGDKVRVVKWNGRKYCDRDHHTELKTGCIAEIWEDEKDGQAEGFVSVTYQGYIRVVPPCYLEIITPVEELEPFKVHKCDDNEYVVLFEGTRVSVYPFKGAGYPYYYTQDDALARAEAECKRLNEEYRKEKAHENQEN